MSSLSIRVSFTDSTEKIVHLLDALYCSSCATSPQSVAVDLEGVDLGREGRTSIMQLFPKNSLVVYLVDLTVLGQQAFEVKNSRGQSLRLMLESIL